MELGKQVSSALRWSAGLRAMGQVVSWAISLIVIRLLAPEAYGLMAITWAVIAFLAQMNELGIGPALIQRVDLTERVKQQALGVVTVLNFGFYALLYTTVPFVADFYNEPELVDLIRIVSLVLPLGTLQVVPRAMLAKKLDFKSIGMIELVSNFAGGVATLAAAWAGLGVWSLAIGNLVIYSCLAIGFNIASPFLRMPVFRLEGAGQLVRFGGLVTVDRLLWFFYSRADVFIIGKLLGTEVLGVYSVAMHLASLPLQRINSLLNEVALPAFASVQSDLQRARRYLRKALRLIALVAFPVFFGLSSVAPEIVGVILGEQWGGATIAILLLALVMPLRMVSSLITTSLLGLGRVDVSVTNHAIGAVLLPLAFLVGCQGGLVGVCVAWLVAFPLYTAIETTRSRPVIALRLGDLGASLGPATLLAAAMYAGVWSMKTLMLENTVSLVGFAAQVLWGTALYGALVWAFHRTAISELRETVLG